MLTVKNDAHMLRAMEEDHRSWPGPEINYVGISCSLMGQLWNARTGDGRQQGRCKADGKEGGMGKEVEDRKGQRQTAQAEDGTASGPEEKTKSLKSRNK